jgi:acetyl esterase/lipase
MSSPLNPILDLWAEGAIPNAISGAALAEISQFDADYQIVAICQISRPTLTVFLPVTEKRTGQGILICPGGGYGQVATEHEGVDIAYWFNGLGIAAFVLKYRLPNACLVVRTHEVPLLDARQGLRLIRQNARHYGLRSNQIGVMGFSAGGHLAAMLSTSFAYNSAHIIDKQLVASSLPSPYRPDFTILVCPVISFSDFAHVGSRTNLLGLHPSSEQITAYSADRQVTPQSPPTLLIHAADDTAVPTENSLRYYAALRTARVSAELHLYPTGGHGFGLRLTGKGSLAGWPYAVATWLSSC